MQENSPPNDPNLTKINVEDIKVGMYMSQPDRPWLATPFMFQGFLLENEELVSQVKQECRYIYIDKEKSQNKKKFTPHSTAGPTRPAPPKINKPIEQLFTKAYNHRKEALSEVKLALKGVKDGAGINVTNIRKSVKSCVVSIMDNPNAMLWLGKLRNKDQYVAEHCLNVGILAVALGRHLGLEQEQLEILGLCGMLHDVGKMKVDQQILNKPARLTDQEFTIIKEHCLLGKQLLEQDPNLPLVTVEAAYSHHERIDGRGYPRGLGAESLNFSTRVISIVDVYDAITTNRCYDSSRPATEAIKILFDGRGTQFDEVLVEQFIECLGIYPTGSMVELHSGEVAVVIDSNKNSRLHPRVTIVLDENKHNRQPLIVDTLEYKNRDGKRTIKRVLNENDYNVNMESVFSNFLP